MNSNNIAYLSLPTTEYENSFIKNKFIEESDSEFIAFINADITHEDEVASILQDMNCIENADYVVLGEGMTQEAGLYPILTHADMRIYTLVVKRDRFVRSGCFNEKLEGLTNYELVCRLSEFSQGVMVECTDDSVLELSTDAQIHTLTYLLGRYMSRLKSEGTLDQVFLAMNTVAANMGCVDTFNKCMNQILSDRNMLLEIWRDTAPILVISGDDTCYGVLKNFANELAKQLMKCGQAVITTDGSYGVYEGLEAIASRPVKAVIGFQSVAIEKEFFKKLEAPKLQFWFDNPIFFMNMLHNLPDDYYILCQDGLYAEYIRKHYNTSNAIAFPPGGRFLCEKYDRDLDVTFIGTYNIDKDAKGNDTWANEFYTYMCANPSLTFEEGLRRVLCQNNKVITDKEFTELLYSLADVCKDVIAVNRKRVIETLLVAGIKIDVYGSSWNYYDGAGRDNLTIHPDVSVEESLRIMARSKISLNIMTWHKAGMTERVANIMMSGAVCVSDETTYLRQHFLKDEIVLFRLDELDMLADTVGTLLDDSKRREQISHDGQLRARSEHTWRNRATEIIALLRTGNLHDEKY